MTTNSKYKPTGFPKGRPRKGEIRPPTPGAIYQARLRAERMQNQEWRDIQAMYQQFWTHAFSEDVKKIKKAAYRREKHWKEAAKAGGVSIKIKVSL